MAERKRKARAIKRELQKLIEEPADWLHLGATGDTFGESPNILQDNAATSPYKRLRT